MFPVELYSKFARHRRLLLAFRCTCKMLAELTGTWKIRIVHTHTNDFSHAIDIGLSRTALGQHGAKYVSCTLLSDVHGICFLESYDNDLGKQLKFAIDTAGEYRLIGENPPIPFRQIKMKAAALLPGMEITDTGDYKYMVDNPYTCTMQSDPRGTVYVDVYALADKFVLPQ